MISFKNVYKDYPTKNGVVTAIKNISLKVEKGDFLVVRGPSGCGKTTLLLTAGGLLKPSNGEVLINGQNPYLMSQDGSNRLRYKTIGFVFQQFYLIPYLTVIQNIKLPELILGETNNNRAIELIEQFGLVGRENHLPHQLSTGEKQRTAIARAIYNNPDLVLADEPTGNLDSENADIIYQYLSQYVKNGGSVLLVSHHKESLKYGTRIIEIKNGEIV